MKIRSHSKLKSFQNVPRRARRQRRGGFTLVELALSVGIVSFSLVSLLGLLPVGMRGFRSAVDTSVGTQITQRVVNEIQESAYANFTDPSSPPPVRYFDDQGEEVTAATKALYYVNTRVMVSPGLLGGTNGNSNKNLATVTVQIADNPGGRALAADQTGLWQPASGVTMVCFSTVIAGNTGNL